jgi:phosphoglycolate phosphatase-like HAD superfamily hydrolase|tara:strand:- start:11531 stop:12691 length:1161 start_codon:yes stop_codon:yes gene_type:complete
MANKYQKKTINNKLIYQKISQNKIKNIDTIIFDCDGVLIDTKKSYDKCIELTISYILKNMINQKFSKFKISKTTIDLFRQTGGFNNDYKCCYVIILKIASMMPKNLTESYKIEYQKINKKKEIDSFIKLQLIKTEINKINKKSNIKIINQKYINELNKFAKEIKNIELESIENQIMIGLNNEQKKFLKVMKEFLNYPKNSKINIIINVFDEFFYGKNFIKKVRKKKFINLNRKGTIENEKIIVKRETLVTLKKKFLNKISIVSGRGQIGTKITLKSLYRYFNSKGNEFIEDLAREQKNNTKFDKPNPTVLKRSASKLKAKGDILYVGDSMEDLLMTQAADSDNNRYLFAGIYGTSRSEKNKIKLFMDNKADIIISNINDIPELISD